MFSPNDLPARLTYSALYLALVPATAAWGDSPGYKELRITNTPRHVENWPRINDHGDVVFRRGVYNDNSRNEIILYSQGQSTQLTSDDISDVFPDINNDRTIVWMKGRGPRGPYGPTYDIARWRDGQIDMLTEDSLSDIGPFLAENGDIVWTQETGFGCRNSPIDSVVLYRDGVIAEQFSDGRSNQTTVMDGDGSIVWTNYDFCPNDWTSEILMLKDGEVRQLSNGPTPQAPCIAPNGIVVWTNDQQFIEVWENGNITRIENIDIPTAPYINSRAYATFSARNSDTGAWDAWLSINGELRVVASTGVNNLVNDINEPGDITIRRGNWGKTDIDIFVMQRLPYGDMNCDGKVTFDDIDGFTLALIDRAEYEAAYPDCDWWLADTSGNRKVDFDDIDPFVECIIKGCER
jgi:hypothetical protein